jgi:ketosteroid isomerase-like protein
MRHLQYFAGALLALLWVSAPALAAGDHDAVLAPIHQFVEALNKGDMKAAAAAHTAAPSIIDDVPPHQWQGSDAFDKWSSSDAAEMQKNGITAPTVKIKAPSQIQVEGDSAYVVVPTVYSFVMKGKKVAETGFLTFALAQQGSDWRIAGWAWTRH